MWKYPGVVRDVAVDFMHWAQNLSKRQKICQICQKNLSKTVLREEQYLFQEIVSGVNNLTISHSFLASLTK